MAANEKMVKTRVGMFIFTSLVLLAVMVVYFGRLGDGFRNYYRLNATFPNASGLLKGADILMAGAKIGMVAEKPKIIEREKGLGVEVPLQIYSGIKVPSKARLMIRRSGLLGDRYVDIIVDSAAVWESDPLPPDTSVSGIREPGFDDLTVEANELIATVRNQLDDVSAKLKRLDSTVLSPVTLQQASDTISNLNVTSKKFAEASGRLDGVLKNTEIAAQEFKATMTDTRTLIKDAKSGKGVLGVLLTDRTMAENLRAFVLNLRQHGILWYKDADGRRR